MISRNIFLSSDFKAMDFGCGIDGITLMGNAAECIYKRLLALNKLSGKTAIICGKGNNGGDGYALACLLLARGFEICLYTVDEPKTVDAAFYCDRYLACGGEPVSSLDAALNNATTVVDCIFGFSFAGVATGVYKDIIHAVNSSGAYILSADIPSGLVADSDCLTDCYITADATCTFTAKKLALASYPAKQACGEIYIEDIGIPSSIIEAHAPYAFGNGSSYYKHLPHRGHNTHKGSFGTLTALVGSRYMTGAAYLSCSAALHSGVGLLRLCSEDACLSAIASKLAEPILCPITTADDILKLKSTAMLIGCGCGRSYDEIIKELLIKTSIPTVIDADGINCIADDIELYKSVKTDIVITPHEMEMARLLRCDISHVKANRLECARHFASEYNYVTVLKGAATIVASPDGRIYINDSGNNGLSKGGSGDVLAGVLASLLAQKMPAFEAAVLSVFLHGKTGDLLAEKLGSYAMLPSMLPLEIGKLLSDR